MACELCLKNTQHHEPHNRQHDLNSDRTYSDNSMMPFEDEPEAPTLSLGMRILWLTESRAASGIVKWIGRIPLVSPGWSAGVEFDNPIPNGGNGLYRGRSYFVSREGHALFLPVSEIIKVDETPRISHPESHRTFNSFFNMKKRDSTYGHFKNSHCSNCVRNSYQLDEHYCDHSPIYDRISSRRSLGYDDHPYELCDEFSPQESSSKHSFHLRKENESNQHHKNNAHEGCSKLSLVRPVQDIDCQQCLKNNFNAPQISRRESLFNLHPSIKLLNDFKEWVSYWVLGTNRQKRKSKLILKNRKTITSLFISQNSHSLTGQRLSSFSDYASINHCGITNSNIKPLMKDSSTNTLRTHEKPVPKIKYHVKNKRPAPPPPIPSSSNSSKGNQTEKIKGIVNSDPLEIVIKEEIKNIPSKNLKDITHSEKQRKKKRRAPRPPNLAQDKISPIDDVEIHNIYSVINRAEKIRRAKILIKELNEKEADSNQSLFQGKIVPSLKQEVKKTDSLDSSSESNLEIQEDNKRYSVSFSAESDDEKYGLVKYGINNLDLNGKDTSLHQSSDYAKEINSNDVCLRISIQKTETNVVTVEEMGKPGIMQFSLPPDTSSDLSDEQESNEKNIENNFESKVNSAETSSISTDELPENSKTIFEELQLKPPSKGSVKDFVNAFNMLADKSIHNNYAKKVSNSSKISQTYNKPLIQESNYSDNTISKSIQSFPTKWEYQNPKESNFSFPKNKILHPIAEESHNDTSENDKGGSNEDLHRVKSTPPKSYSKENHNDRRENISQIIDDKMENASNYFIHYNSLEDQNQDSLPIGKKKLTKKLHKTDGLESLKKSSQPHMTQASMKALAALLHERANSPQGKLQDSPSTSNINSKVDQPIMVSLYIEDKSSHRGPIPLLITPSMSLRKLKKEIEKEYNFPREQQCWILGESFAIRDEVSLAKYGVIETGCPVLLYVMSKEPKTNSLHLRPYSSASRHVGYDSSSSDSESECYFSSKTPPKLPPKSENREKGKHPISMRKGRKSPDIKSLPSKMNFKKQEATKERKKEHQLGYKQKQDYQDLVAMDDVDLVANVEAFECPICFLDIDAKEGVVLQDCLHSFCKECLAGAIQFSDTALVKCPFRNDEYSCESHLQEREIKSLVSPVNYERHLQRSMALAESQAQDSFHCKTPDCPGWCLYEDRVNMFLCPVCKRTNCLTCAAIHEGKNCRQYQDDVAFHCDSSEEAKKTKEYLQNMLKEGEAMECPQCQVILMKKWGCDWLKCSMCHTEVCWVTKGPRWGPGGRGDTSGGCKCMVDGVRCHPKCSYCH